MLTNLHRIFFQILFSLGFFCLIYACLLWIFYGLFGIGDFPIQDHANLLVGGFITYILCAEFCLSFFTSVPEKKDSEKEVFILILLLSVSFISVLLGAWTSFWCANVLLFLLLLICSLRFNYLKINRTNSLSIFSVFGLVLGFIGASLILMNEFNDTFKTSMLTLGKLFFYDGAVTAFFIGGLGGSKFLSNEGDIKHSSFNYLSLILLGIFVNAIILESFGFIKFSFLLRGGLLTYIGLYHLKVHQNFKDIGWDRRTLKIGWLLMVIVCFALSFIEGYLIHLKHMVYLGSFCLLAFIISSKQVLFIGQYKILSETNKMPYLLIGVLAIFAGMTRSSAVFLPASYGRHLSYAAFVLLCAGIVWGYFFGKKVFTQNTK